MWRSARGVWEMCLLICVKYLVACFFFTPFPCCTGPAMTGRRFFLGYWLKCGESGRRRWWERGVRRAGWWGLLRRWEVQECWFEEWCCETRDISLSTSPHDVERKSKAVSRFATFFFGLKLFLVFTPPYWDLKSRNGMHSRLLYRSPFWIWCRLQLVLAFSRKCSPRSYRRPWCYHQVFSDDISSMCIFKQ